MAVASPDHLASSRVSRRKLPAIVGASVRGSSHERSDMPCQDCFAVRRLPSGVTVAAVSDGAGSAPSGNVGATMAVDAAVVALSAACARPRPPTRAQMLQTVQLAKWVVEREAEYHSRPVSEFATTLIAFAFMSRWLRVVQIGDGAVVCSTTENALRAVTQPDNGEYANQTVFVTSPGALFRVQTASVDGLISGVAAFTDGMQMLALKMPDGIPHRPFFEPLFRFCAHSSDREDADGELARFLQSPRVRDRADDDLTLVLATFTDQGDGT